MKRNLKRILFYAAYILFLFVLAELGARCFWLARGLPFLTAQRKFDWIFYPELKRLKETPVAPCSDCFDVLILSGSALTTRWGSIEHILREELSRRTRKRIRLYNLAIQAHTSLDSYYKYKHLQDRHFDLVVLYHGINDVRANNCPPSMFRPDYSHYSWYEMIDDFERKADSRWLVLPYTLKYIFVIFLWQSHYVPTDRPKAKWLDYGCDIKTTGPFRENIERIIQIARKKHEVVLLMTYSYYIPEGYSEEKFNKRALDYTAYHFPVEQWGKPACVAKGVDAHNAVIRELAPRYDNVVFVDQEREIPKSGLYFNDVCHLTHRGCERFVDNILNKILHPTASPLSLAGFQPKPR